MNEKTKDYIHYLIYEMDFKPIFNFIRKVNLYYFSYLLIFIFICFGSMSKVTYPDGLLFKDGLEIMLGMLTFVGLLLASQFIVVLVREIEPDSRNLMITAVAIMSYCIANLMFAADFTVWINNYDIAYAGVVFNPWLAWFTTVSLKIMAYLVLIYVFATIVYIIKYWFPEVKNDEKE